LTQSNLQEAIANLASPEARKQLSSPEQFLRVMQEDADMSRLKDLK
jgi:hypothetical protein